MFYQHYGAWWDLLKVLKRQHGGDELVLSLLYYLYQQGDISDESQFKALIATELPSDLGEKTMTLAELHTQRGIQQGVQQGEQGKSRVIAKNLLREGLDPAFVQKTTGVEMTVIQEIFAELETDKV